MKKILLVATALVVLGSTQAFAHCHGGGHRSGGNYRTTYSICNYENCNLDYNHQHDGCNYYGHYYGDGHDYHDSYCGNGGYGHC